MNDLIRDRQAPRDSRLHHSSDNGLITLIDDRQTSREEELQARYAELKRERATLREQAHQRAA